MALVHDDDDIIGTINITPFVDIILVVLIIFMVTSTAIAKAAFEVELPQAASAGEAVNDTLNIVVTREGGLQLDGESVTAEVLASSIAARARQNAEGSQKLQAVIAADKHVDYGVVIGVIDLLKLNGVNSFALNIERTASAS